MHLTVNYIGCNFFNDSDIKGWFKQTLISRQYISSLKNFLKYNYWYYTEYTLVH